VHPAVRGDSVIGPEHLRTIVAALDAAGIAVHFHGVGDRAVRECLDAVEYARAENESGSRSAVSSGSAVSSRSAVSLSSAAPSAPRHQIAHLDVVDPADFARFAELGVSANLQPLWARDDQEILERKFPLIGPDRARFHFPFGSLQRAGAHLAMGSDWPVTSPDPLWGLHTACTRTAPAADVHALNPEARVSAQPEQRLSVDDAIRAYTLGSAETSVLAAEIGSLAVGKRADVVILSGPIGAPEDFDRVRVARTLLGGETVYAAG